MAKLEARHREEFGRKAAADYKKLQDDTALGDGYGTALGPDTPVWNGGTGSGHGISPRATGSSIYGVSAADDDGVSYTSLDGQALNKCLRDPVVFAKVIDKMVAADPNLTREMAMSRIHVREKQQKLGNGY